MDKYFLMDKDTPVLSFACTMRSGSYLFDLVDLISPNHLPPYLKRNQNNLGDMLMVYLFSRLMSDAREFRREAMNDLNLHYLEWWPLLLTGKGTSLNDSYWIKSAHDEATWSRISPYTNPLDLRLADLFLLGESGQERTGISPEMTTQGMLAKAWVKEEGNTFLVKRGSFGYANAGREPFVECMVVAIGDFLGIPMATQDLSQYAGHVVTKSPNFTSEATSFVEAVHYVVDLEPNQWTYEALVEIFDDRADIARSLVNMQLLDYLTHNTDRHWRNFGFLVDNQTKEVIGQSPLYDQGYALYHSAMAQYDNPFDFGDLSQVIGPTKGSDLLDHLKAHLAKEMVGRLEGLYR